MFFYIDLDLYNMSKLMSEKNFKESLVKLKNSILVIESINVFSSSSSSSVKIFSWLTFFRIEQLLFSSTINITILIINDIVKHKRAMKIIKFGIFDEMFEFNIAQIRVVGIKMIVRQFVKKVINDFKMKNAVAFWFCFAWLTHIEAIAKDDSKVEL